MSKYNRFLHEQQLLECWTVTSDIETVMKAVLEKDLPQDHLANILLGMKELYNLKFEALWESFELSCKNRE